MRATALVVAVSLGMLALGCARKEAAAPMPKETLKPAAEAPAGPAKATQPEPAPAAAPEAKAPTAKPSGSDRIAALIVQLGDQDYAVREQATKELAALGKSAESALEAAAKSPDAETAIRAKDLLGRLKGSAEEAEAPEIPGLAEAVRGNRGGGIQVQAGAGGQVRVVAQAQAGGGMQVIQTVSGGNSARTVSNDNGSATVGEGADGAVSLTLTPKGGQAKTFSAASREEFKKKYPNLYAKYLGD